MKTNAEGLNVWAKAADVCKKITHSSQANIYLILSSIPLGSLAIQSIENEGMQFGQIIGLASISTAIGYYLNSYIKKTNKSLEKCLKDSENNTNLFQQNIENLELLLKNIPGVGFFVMKGDTYVKVNENFARMTGRSSDEIMGKTDKELFPLLPDHIRNRLLESNNDSLKNNKNQETLEETISLPLHDGEHIIMLKKSPFIKKDKKFIIGVAIDITTIMEEQNILEEQKILAEEMSKKAEETAKLKSDFLANMSHELRTPLNPILGFAQLLLNREKDEEKRIILKRIITGGENLLELINNLLDMQRINVGMFSVGEHPVNLQKTISQIIEQQNSSINKSPHVIILKHESIENIDEYILSDEIRITQILNNLVGNAIKFTDTGYITISCSKIEDLGDKQKIYLSVQDTGIGIPDDKLDIIFERFRQVDNSNTRQYGGTGLGLSLVREISQYMGGDVTVESKLGIGSTFTFSFITKKQKEIKKKENNIEQVVYCSRLK